MMEIRPPRRRAAQATAVVMLVAGALTLFTSVGSMAFVPDSRGGFWLVLGASAVGVLLLVFGRKLLAWGSGDET